MAGGGGGEVEEAGPKKNSFGETAVQSVDLNLTALMDILSNLLFFLLASFGATIVMAINTSVPVQSADKSDVADTKQTVTLNIKLTKEKMDVSAQGSAQDDAELDKLKRTFLAGKDGEHDYKGLAQYLLGVKEKYPRSDTIILMPDPGVSYEAMVKVMDASREIDLKQNGILRTTKLFPTVVISGVVK